MNSTYSGRCCPFQRYQNHSDPKLGTEYTPQWIKIPNLASSYHKGRGLESSDSHVGLYWAYPQHIEAKIMLIDNQRVILAECYSIYNLSIPNDWSSREGDSSDSFVAERRYPPFNLKWNDCWVHSLLNWYQQQKRLSPKCNNAGKLTCVLPNT